MSQAVEILGIKRVSQLGHLDKHCRSLLRQIHPDKVAEGKKEQHTARTQAALDAKKVVKENPMQAADIVRNIDALGTLPTKGRSKV